jgi:hypothetical protein
MPPSRHINYIFPPTVRMLSVLDWSSLFFLFLFVTCLLYPFVFKEEATVVLDKSFAHSLCLKLTMIVKDALIAQHQISLAIKKFILDSI